MKYEVVNIITGQWFADFETEQEAVEYIQTFVHLDNCLDIIAREKA